MKQKLTAVIAGGGIGGLAAAAALGMRGWDVTLFERQDALRASGSGIYIWENGLRVLEALGAAEAATQHAFRGHYFEQRDNLGGIIESAPIRADKRLMTVRRPQLLAALADAARRYGAKIVTGCEVTGATARGELLLSDGRRVSGDLALGVDGVWSRVRQSLGLEVLHEQAQEGALRTVIEAMPGDIPTADAGKYIENWNGPLRLLITPVNDREIYLALTCPATNARAKSTTLDKALWGDAFPAWRHLIDRVGADVSWGVYSVTKVTSWSAGRTAILGDAAFAQPPNLGQGGGMAMQSALALSVALADVADARDIPAALVAWETQERPLVDHCQKWSCLYGEVANLPDEVRTMTIRAAMSNPWVSAQVFRAANHIPTGTGHIPVWDQR
ncbi:NAD(P)/FAD-dependent oxidoreductase [Paraburkholderia sp.]|uniref:FAD-dependent oxidoreductase n=1 Tax=Paraburkholderia sp. TaxID=1926495 RepID=UPI00238E5B61|nr:NAD(P)/FAD-dependent oxidoreductase [Paraburkholderia sp.]MDE1180515.1 NAD(P)/FAD-dependent oxidoreductase [Paraburkholderia sp.]